MRGVLITGAGKRVGAFLAEWLAARGWFVFVHYNRSGADARAVVERIQGAGGRASAIGADLEDAAALEPMIAAAAATADVDLVGLVNNASLFEYDLAESFDPAMLARHLAVNAAAPIQLARAFAARLPAGRTGAVVNFLDQKLFNLNPDFFTYTVSKIALGGSTELLARALAPRVRVNAVAPSLVLPSGDQTPEEFDAVKDKSILVRQTRLEEIAEGVVYLLTAEALTGQVLHLDSGQRYFPSARDIMFSTRG